MTETAALKETTHNVLKNDDVKESDGTRKNSKDSGRSCQGQQLADGSTKEFCRVCGDCASGVHFGVFSCEGCKGFFKRSQHVDCQTGLREYFQYRCLNQVQCVVTPSTRNACRYCRFTRCVNVGMSKQAIKLGRRCKKLKKNTRATSDHISKNTKFRQMNETKDSCITMPSYPVVSTLPSGYADISFLQNYQNKSPFLWNPLSNGQHWMNIGQSYSSPYMTAANENINLQPFREYNFDPLFLRNSSAIQDELRLHASNYSPGFSQGSNVACTSPLVTSHSPNQVSQFWSHHNPSNFYDRPNSSQFTSSNPTFIPKQNHPSVPYMLPLSGSG